MSNPIETAGRYIVDIAGRTVGIKTALEYYAENGPDSDYPLRQSKRFALIGSAAMALAQACIPLGHRGLVDEYRHTRIGSKYPQPYNEYLGTFGFMAGITVDAISSFVTLKLAQDNPTAGIIFKLTANALSNMAADIVVAGVNRFRNHHSNNITLAE